MAARQTIESAVRWISLLTILYYISVCSGSMKCTDIKHAYRLKKFDAIDVPLSAISGHHLQICDKGSTCCTGDMEKKLTSQSRLDYNTALAKSTSFLRNTFISRTVKFDEFFTELLANAKRDLHDMFVRTYGLLYQQNSHVFMDLFHDLEGYYKGQNIDLVEAQKEFFEELLQKMFLLLNGQYEFDESYLNCVSKYMDELKPFGDVPQKLSGQVKRAFIAARTFVQGLAVGRDIVMDVMKIEPTQSCDQALMKMSYCPYCNGIASAKPCPNYCLNVMKGCLANQADLNDAWDKYIEGLMMVADRLEGPFNIESVVDPIDVKISEAIMNFQENSKDLTPKVFAGCGQPRLGRKRRETNTEDGSDGYAFNWRVKTKDTKVRPTTAAGTSLDRLVRDIREKVNLAKGVWKNLPYALCNDQLIAMQPAELEYKNCWNGTQQQSYTMDVVKDGLKHQAHNPEVTVDTGKENLQITQAIRQLKAVANKLKKAYSGLDVDWIDTSEGDDDYTPVRNDGSGSGDDSDGSSDDGETGSGDGSDDDGSGYNGSGHGSPYQPRGPTGYQPPYRNPVVPRNTKKPDDDINFATTIDPKYHEATEYPRIGPNSIGFRTYATVATVLIPLCTLFFARW